MPTTITQVQNTLTLTNAEFIRITVGSTVYAFSNSYRTETFNGTPFSGTYTNLGGLVSVSGHQRELSITSYDTVVELAGVDKTKIGMIIDAGLKGSKIEVYRGFYNSTYQLIDNLVQRYTGIITSYVIISIVF